jgi:hypothetical protein
VHDERRLLRGELPRRNVRSTHVLPVIAARIRLLLSGALALLAVACAAHTPVACVEGAGAPYRFECRGAPIDRDVARALCGEGRLRCGDASRPTVPSGVPGELYCDHGVFRDAMTMLDGTSSRLVCDDSNALSFE